MDMRSGLEGLQSLLGVHLAERVSTNRTGTASVSTSDTLSFDHATLSSAGTEVAHSVADDGVRSAKVLTVQSAIAAGTYRVPASAVAGKIIDSMLHGGK